MARGIPGEVIRYFRAVPLFGALSQRELRTVVQAASEVDEPAGKVLAKEGEEGREMFVLIRGTARVSRAGRKMRDLGPGDFFGELAMLTRGTRSATVTATSDVRLFVLGPQEFERVAGENSKIAVGMLAAVATRLRDAERSALH